MINKKLFSINELKPGMISAVDINLEDNVLLAKGTAITQAAITKLMDHYIVDTVEVLLEESSEKPITIKIESVKELESTLNELSSNLEDIFKNLTNFKGSNIIQLRMFLKKVQEEFKATGTVIKNILFYGSGEDTIFRHSINVSAISFILGKWLGFDEKELNILTFAAILHDFGKMEIDDDILKKEEKDMTTEECEIYRSHPISGYHFVKKIQYISPLIGTAILLHHERMDGSGYPLHFKSDKIPELSRIIAIADIFDNVSSNRYSAKAKGPFEALKVIKDESLTKLDTKYCNMFLNHIINYYMGETVVLSDKRTAKIIQVQINNLTQPLLLGDDGFIDLKSEKNLFVESLVI